MTTARMALYAGGALSALMALFHSRFPAIFGWDEDFGKITLKNKRIFYTIHIALTLLFAGFALLSFSYAAELAQARGLASGVLVFYSAFWLWRTAWLVYYFPFPKEAKWRIVTCSMGLVFASLCVAYAIPLFCAEG